MSPPVVEFHEVWKKFRRGERHDSLRDLIPSAVSRLLKRRDGGLGRDEFWAVHDVSFDVQAGEALGIIGPNGAGKSTVLKLLTRILRPTAGRAAVHGRVGALIEVAAGFHPDLTGRENIHLQGTIMGMRRAEIDKHFDEIVDFSGVGPFVDTPVKRYSSGMHARLGFAVAAHMEPDVLLVDEVLSVGDLSFQQRCMDKMREKVHSGTTVVLVSHNLQSVASLCARAIVLKSGRMVFDGSSGHALDAYLEAARDGSARHGAATDKFRLRSAEFQVTSGDNQEQVTPHAPCELRVALECLEDGVPCSIGVDIERTKDLLFCYGTTTQDLGLELIQPRRGDVVSVTLRFRAHFARGHYRISVHVRDPKGAACLHFAESVASFTIDEQVSYDGVVDVNLDALIEVAPASTMAVASSAALR